MINLYVITGFLGAGKTKFLNHYLKHHATSKNLVIENEFRKVNIDSRLITEKIDEVVELTNGCICCSLDNELVEVLPSIKKLKVKDTITEITLLTDYDNYYYNKDRSLPLPVYRIKFSDKLKTWYYINPTNATVVRKKQKDSRFERWIYNGSHSMDFAFIFYKRPLWDIVVLVLLIGCTMLSFTGLKLTINSNNKWYKIPQR